jgi:hypothetical protein
MVQESGSCPSSWLIFGYKQKCFKWIAIHKSAIFRIHFEKYSFPCDWDVCLTSWLFRQGTLFSACCYTVCFWVLITKVRDEFCSLHKPKSRYVRNGLVSTYYVTISVSHFRLLQQTNWENVKLSLKIHFKKPLMLCKPPCFKTEGKLEIIIKRGTMSHSLSSLTSFDHIINKT